MERMDRAVKDLQGLRESIVWVIRQPSLSMHVRCFGHLLGRSGIPHFLSGPHLGSARQSSRHISRALEELSSWGWDVRILRRLIQGSK
jgi:hypothetical protein